MGLEFDIVPSNFDEQLDDNRTPQEVAAELALGKALAVAKNYPGQMVIASDTIVTVNGRQLGKPKDEQEAHEMLRMLSGTFNDVTTAVAIVRLADSAQMVNTDATKVYFKPYDAQAVARYLASGDFADKAGGYGIQSGAAPLISHIEGHYDTVVGLPTHVVADLLEQFGITVQPIELPPPVRQVLP